MKAKITKNFALHEAWCTLDNGEEKWTLTRTLPDGGLRAEFNRIWFEVSGGDLAQEFLEACKEALAKRGDAA